MAAASPARRNAGPEPAALHRFSSCCWKPHSPPTSLRAQPAQCASALGQHETLVLSLPALVLSQHPQYDSLHSLSGRMLLPCLMLGDPQGGAHRRLAVSPLLISGHRIPAWQGLEGTSVGHPAQPPAQAGSPRAGCTAPCPVHTSTLLGQGHGSDWHAAWGGWVLTWLVQGGWGSAPLHQGCRCRRRMGPRCEDLA